MTISVVTKESIDDEDKDDDDIHRSSDRKGFIV